MYIYLTHGRAAKAHTRLSLVMAVFDYASGSLSFFVVKRKALLLWIRPIQHHSIVQDPCVLIACRSAASTEVESMLYLGQPAIFLLSEMPQQSV